MKKFLFPFIGAAIALVSLNGCQQEPTPDDNNTNSNQVVGYAAFSIKKDSPNTRAYTGGEYEDDFNDEFNKGSEDEYALSENNAAHRAFFFDDNGAFFGSAMLTSLKEIDGNEHKNESEHESGYGDTETYYAALTKHAASGAVTPTKVLVVLNAHPYRLDELEKELAGKGDGALQSALQWISLNAKDSYGKDKEEDGVALYNDGETVYFTMSSVTYIPDGGDTGAVETAVDITNHLYPTPEEASGDPVTVYVERVVAKVTVGSKKDLDNGGYSFSNIAGEVFEPTVWAGDNSIPAAKLPVVSEYNPADNIAKADNKDWSIKIVNWGLNALEPNTFLFKNLVRPGAQYTVSDEFFTNWNAAAYHRSYWAVDQHYLDDYNFDATSRTGHNYSAQYRPFAGKEQGVDYETFEGHEVTTGLSLDYFSYNDIVNGGEYINRYSLENTFDYEDAKKMYAPLRYGTHVLLAAELLILNEDNEFEATDLFYAYSVYWKDYDDYKAYAFSKMCSTYADGKAHEVMEWNTEKFITLPTAYDKKLYKESGEAISSEDLKDYFGKPEPALIEHGDGKVVMSYTGEPIYYKNEDDELVKLTEEQVKTIIYSFSDAAKHFNNGMMYYALPIHHNRVDVALTNDENAEPYDTGDFGVVRNHWYRLYVKTIGSVGTPVDDPKDPIIPNDPEEDLNIAMEIVILPWRIVEEPDIRL